MQNLNIKGWIKCLPVLILLMFGAAAKSQTRDQLIRLNTIGNNNQNGAFRGVLFIPMDTLSTADSGAIAYKAGMLYVKTLTKWQALGGQFDSTSLSNRINQKFNTADSTFILQPYQDALLLKQDKGNYLTALTGDGEATSPIGGGVGVFVLSNTPVTPGTYPNATVSVDSKGRVIAIAAGAGGGSGTDNANVGAYYRLLTGTQGIKTLRGINGITIDSTTTANALTIQVDSSVFVTASDLAAMQPLLGYVPENVANKSTDPALPASDILYPSINAVKSYINTQLALKQNILGFTPENVANKSTNVNLSTSNTLYPTENAVKTYVDGKIAAIPGLTVDPVPTDGSNNPVASNGVYDALITKQPNLISGINIKTINGLSILGSGDLPISGGGGGAGADNGFTGSGVRPLYQGSQNLRTLFATGPLVIDTTTNPLGITFGIPDGSIGNAKLTNSSINLTAPGITGTAPNYSAGSAALGGAIGLNLPNASGVGVTRGLVSNNNYTDWYNKQDALISGINLKTVNGNSLLGSGDLVIGGGGGTTYIFTPADFNESGSTISIDYANGQKATNSQPGFMTAADRTAFAAKQNAITLGSTSQYFRGDLSLATFPTNLSDFTNGPGFITASSSDILTSKTWNGAAILPAYGGAPAGGSTGQVLTKVNGTDYNYTWQTPAAGGSGSDNGMVGSGFRPLSLGTQNLRTIFGGIGITIDSTTNANALTYKVDTATINTPLIAAINARQPVSASLTSIAGLTIPSAQMLYTTGTNTFAFTSLTGFSRSILSVGNAASWRGGIGAQASLSNIGSSYRLYDGTAGIKTVRGYNGILVDSSTSNTLSIQVDSTLYPTQSDLAEAIAGVSGGGTNNGMVGAGFRPLSLGTQNLRTWFGSTGITIDSTSNSNGLTVKPDTSFLTTVNDFKTINGNSIIGAGNITISGGGNLPAGGTAGQILAKINSTDYNAQWIPAPTGIEYGTGIGLDTDGENNFLLDTAYTSGKYVQRGNLVAGSNMTITPVGNQYVFSSTASGLTNGNKSALTVSGDTWTLNADVVDNTILADMPTARFKARTTAGTGNPEDITGTQATAMLDLFSTTAKGLVPAATGGSTTSQFLRKDGTWAVTPGLLYTDTLDMLSDYQASLNIKQNRYPVTENKRYYFGEKHRLYALNTSTGAKVSNSAVDISDYLKITPSENITISTRDGSTFTCYGWWYTNSLTAISEIRSSALIGTLVSSYATTAPSNAAYLIVYVRAAGTDFSKILEIKSTSTITYLAPIFPEDFAGSAPAQKINNALDFARVTSSPVVVPSGRHLINTAVIMNSNNTLILDGAELHLENGTHDNIIRNEAVANPAQKFVRGNANIKVIGRGGAKLQGSPEDWSLQNLKGAEIWRTYGSLFVNVDGLEVKNLEYKATHFSAMGFEFDRNFTVDNIYFDQGYEHLNQAGIIVYNGSHNGSLSNLSGTTRDDFFEIGNGGYLSDRHLIDSSLYPGVSTDVREIVVQNVVRYPSPIYPGATVPFNSYQGALRILAFQGRKVHDITISGVTGYQNMLIQDHFGGYDETPNGVYNINVNDFQGPIYIGDAIANSSFINIPRYGVGESYEAIEAPAGSTNITRKFYDYSQEYMELAGTTPWVTFGGGSGGSSPWDLAANGIEYRPANSSSARRVDIINGGTGGTVLGLESDVSLLQILKRGSGSAVYGELKPGAGAIYDTDPNGIVLMAENSAVKIAGKSNLSTVQFSTEGGYRYMNFGYAGVGSGYPGIRVDTTTGVMTWRDNVTTPWTGMGGGGSGGGENLAATLTAGNLTGGTAIRFSGSGTDRDVNLYRGNIADGLAITSMKAATGTNAGTGLFLYPRGTGFSSGTVNTSLTLWNTDFETDATNYARFQVYASGSGYIINSNNSGSATLQPIRLQVSETDALRINTDRSLTVNSAYTLPLSAGSANQVLAMPSSGTQLIWASAGSGSSQWTLSGTDLYPTTGTEVGIGTSSPNSLLHLSANANSAQGLRIANTNTGSSAFGRIVFENDASAAAGVILMNSSTATAYSGAGGMTIGTVANSGLVFLTNGNVGFSLSNTGVPAFPQVTGSVTDMVTISSTGVIGRAAIPSGGSGLTSVGLSVPSFLTVSGSPLTANGTLALSYSGTALPAANGGTGQTSYTTGDMLYASSSSALSKLGAGTFGYFLGANGAGSAPSWKPLPGAGQDAAYTTLSVVTTNATPTYMSGNMPTLNGENGLFEITIYAVNSDNSSNFIRKIKASYKNVSNVLLINALVDDFPEDSYGSILNAANVEVLDEGGLTGHLVIRVTGVSGQSVQWRAEIKKYSVFWAA